MNCDETRVTHRLQSNTIGFRGPYEMVKVEYVYPSRLEGITSSQNDFEEVVEQVEELFNNAGYSSSWVFAILILIAGYSLWCDSGLLLTLFITPAFTYIAVRMKFLGDVEQAMLGSTFADVTATSDWSGTDVALTLIFEDEEKSIFSTGNFLLGIALLLFCSLFCLKSRFTAPGF